jgi:hypothetical protein
VTSNLSAGDLQACRDHSSLADLYVIALNPGSTPQSQTPQLFGCYPSTTPCGAAPPDPLRPPASPRRLPHARRRRRRPRARDGQTLGGQASHVQNAFTAHYGEAAGARWHAEHEADLARSASAGGPWAGTS